MSLPQTHWYETAESKPKKPFKFGFIIGRFNHIHQGHERMINYGMELCENLLVLVGSAQEKGTVRNPFDVYKRIDAIRKIYGHSINVGYIDDLTDENDINYEWGRYVLNTVQRWASIYGIEGTPDVTIYGNDEDRQGWYDPADIEFMAQLVVPRARYKISATELRAMMVADNRKDWSAFVNPAIHFMYDDLRKDLLDIPEYREMT